MAERQNVPSKGVKTPKKTVKTVTKTRIPRPAKPKPTLELNSLGFAIEGRLTGHYSVWAVPEFIEQHLIFPYALNDFRAWLQTATARQLAFEPESGRNRLVFDCAEVVRCLPDCLAPLLYMDGDGVFENVVTKSTYLSCAHIPLRFPKVSEADALSRCADKALPVGFGLDQLGEDLIMGFWLEGLEKEFADGAIAR